jgi:hypothetical protein
MLTSGSSENTAITPLHPWYKSLFASRKLQELVLAFELVFASFKGFPVGSVNLTLEDGIQVADTLRKWWATYDANGAPFFLGSIE